MKKALLILMAASAGFATNASQDPIKTMVSSAISAELGSKASGIQYEITATVPGSNNVIHVYGLQQFQGLSIYGTNFNLSFNDNELINFNHSFVPDPHTLYSGEEFTLSPHEALQRIAGDFPINSNEIKEISFGHYTYSDVVLSDEMIRITKLYLLEGALLIPVYEVSLYEKNHEHWYNTRINAITGSTINRNDWVTSCQPFDLSNQSRSAAPRNSGIESVNKKSALSSYTVFAIPTESPNHGPRITVDDPDDSLSSPYGWHDINGSTGTEFTITRGNNVYASEDKNNDNVAGYSPDGGSALTFNSAFDINQSAANYVDASIINLFYLNNVMHDVWYHYGFDEASGNFQQNNYGRGGIGGDYVNADAQDGSGTNNANMATPADGSNPRMQMFLWNAAVSGDYFQVNSPSNAEGKYLANVASFGPTLTTVPITGDLVLVDDGTGQWSQRGCNTLTNGSSVNGKIAFIERGNCTFVSKVLNAQNAGAIGVVIYDSTGNNPIQMGGNDNSVTIPAVMITRNDGLFLKGLLSSGAVNVSLYDSSTSGSNTYDSDFDNGVIAHEYTHGISNRLTGGPAASGCLSNEEQMGEGWSDFFGLVMTHEPGDSAHDVRGIGTYVSGESVTAGGIRTYPYSVDLSISPYTYDNVKNLSVPHGVGSVWCSMLWDLYWRMIEEHGYDADIYNGTGGNNKAMQLVMDGMKIQPCNPGFSDGRDAIIQADFNNYNGENQRLIWEVFARRGLGFSSSQGSSNSRSDGSQAFDLPPYLDELFVEKRAADEVDNGDSITYTLVIKNFTGNTQFNIEVKDTLDANLSVQNNLDCGASVNADVITYFIDSIQNLDSVLCSFKARTMFENTSVVVFSDDMESGINDWTTQNDNGTNGWSQTTNRKNSGLTSWFVPNASDESDLSLIRSFTLDGTNPILSFAHRYNSEAGWDGGVVEIRETGGQWVDVSDLFLTNGYNAVIQVNPASAISGQPAFSGSNGRFVTSTVNLETYANKDVDIRFRFVSDGAANAEGWYVDDVKIEDGVILENRMTIYYDGKSGSSSVNTQIKGDGLQASIEVLANTDILVYPNPSEDYLIIEVQENSDFEYRLTNVDGKEILYGTSKGKVQINVKDVATGVYFCEVKTNGTLRSIKVLIN